MRVLRAGAGQVLCLLAMLAMPVCTSCSSGGGLAPQDCRETECLDGSGTEIENPTEVRREERSLELELPDSRIQDVLPEVTEDAGMDADEDADGSGGPLCGNGLLPEGVGMAGEGNEFLVKCTAGDLIVTGLDQGIWRLRYPGSQPQPDHSYAVVEKAWGGTAIDYGGAGESFEICSDSMRLVVNLPDCTIAAHDLSGNALVVDGPGGGYAESVESTDNGEVTVRKLVRATPADELFYGFGEKNGPLDKRGMKFTFWNSDTPGYPADHDPLYQSIPFFIGLKGGTAYGVFVDNSFRMEFDMAATVSDRYELKAYGGEMDTYIIVGPEIRDVLSGYGALTGRMELPPLWSLGYHQARWSYYPDTQVKEICEGFRSRRIPADGIWLDIDYMDGYRSWTWDPVGFSDPPGLIADLEDIGFKTVAIIDPGLKLDPQWDIYAEGLAGEHFLMDPSGGPFVGEVWPGASVYPDFTRPETREWWAGLVPRVTEAGVRGIWLDMNEPANFLAEDGYTVPGSVTAHGDGHPTSMDGIHNVYALMENMATFAGLLAARPDRRPFLLTRAGFAGIQRYTAVWTGDAPSDFSAVQSVVPMLLGLGLSGVPFVGSDVGGWTGGATPELFARWIQVGSISPFFRGHVATDTAPQEPWAFGLEVEDIGRIAISLRYRLLPYLYTLFREASLTGVPVLRPLVLEFQSDPTTYSISHQAMLGPWLMFAPVTGKGAVEQTIYFPPGKWLELHSGALLEGPGYATVSLSLQALPVFLREGAILPRGPLMQYTGELPLDPLQLDLFPGSVESTWTLYEDDGVSREYIDGTYAQTEFVLSPAPDGATLTAVRTGGYAPPDRRILVRLRRVDNAPASASLDDISLPELASYESLTAASDGWYHDANDLSLWITFQAPQDFVLTTKYVPAIVEPVPDVLVPLRIQVPEGTPPTETVHIATSAANWAQQPLEWSEEPGFVQGLVPVPRGEWFEYKYTRGTWDTVEKWGGCLETTNRYAFGMAHPTKEDSVEMWADDCE